MSIKTDGIINADDFKVTDTVDAGFLKNDPAGNILFGQAASAWDLIETKEIASATNSITFTGLTGAVEKQYLLMFRCKSEGANVTTNEFVEVRPNGAVAGLGSPNGHNHAITVRTALGDAGPGLIYQTESPGWELWRSSDPTISFDVVGRLLFNYDPLNGDASFGGTNPTGGGVLRPGYNYPLWQGFNASSDGTRLRAEYTGGGWRVNQVGQFDFAENHPAPGIPDLSSLELLANTANGISAGSSWHLYKYAP